MKYCAALILLVAATIKQQGDDMTPTPTCGMLYRTFEEQCPTLPFLQPEAIPHGDVRLADRAIGHMRGQAEKVYLGACQAFMIRPAPDWFKWATLAMEYVCMHYGLEMVYGIRAGELWGCATPEIGEDISRLLTYAIPNTRLWHGLRATWCGIPTEAIDRAYHLREGYRARCEPIFNHEGEDIDGYNRL